MNFDKYNIQGSIELKLTFIMLISMTTLNK